MNGVLRNVFFFYRKKGPLPDVQRQRRGLDSRPVQLIQYARGKMQARGGRGHGAVYGCPKGLVTVYIRRHGFLFSMGTALTTDVRGERRESSQTQ